MSRYFVAHVRGADYQYLRQVGFVCWESTIDDYAFLPDTPEHRHLLKQELSLKVFFLKVDDQHATISEDEFQHFKAQAIGSLQPGTPIVVVNGPYANLHGVITAVNGDTYTCTLESYHKRYVVDLTIFDLVIKDGNYTERHVLDRGYTND
jgi:hypothetical protein